MSGFRRFSLQSAARGAFVLFLLLFFSVILPNQNARSAPSATYMVNNSGDAPDEDLDDGVCDSDISTPALNCSLRAAIMQANAPNSGHDRIEFDESRFIAPTSELPATTNDNGVTIVAENKIVYILGTNLSSGDGLTLDSDNNIIMGLVVANFDNGIVVYGDDNLIGTNGNGVNDANEGNVIYSNTGGTGYGVALAGNYNIVAGNIIGLTANGSDSGPNTTGMMVSGNNNRIGTDGDGVSDILERNLISSNTQFGMGISGDDTIVAGNYIGLDKDGDTARGNGSNGVDIDVLSSGTRVGTDSNGSGDAAERNIISGNGGDGVTTRGDVITISGNTIGLSAIGNLAIPNGEYGVSIGNFSYQTVVGTNGDGTRDSIEGNYISGNSGGGVQVTGDARQSTTIAGNKIGTNVHGTSDYGNGGDGVYASGEGTGLVIGTDGDGVADDSERNIISGNSGNGVYLSTSTSHAVVAGNHIGTNTNGTGAIPNDENGVLLDSGANHNRIGSNADGSSDTQERNLISGNGGSGVWIEGIGTDKNKVTVNYIGTTAAGTAALPNQGGVRVDDQAAENLIGAEVSSNPGNLISGNSSAGIYIGGSSDTTLVSFNVIGRNASNSAALPNSGHGIYLTGGAFNSNITGNTIANNSGAGIYMGPTAGSGNYYNINRIFENGGLGVDLAPSGVTPNDPGDADSGPNDLMNYPEIRRLVKSGGWIMVEGVLDSDPDKNFRYTIYQVESCDPSGYGEGGGSTGVQYSSGSNIKTDSTGLGIFVDAVGGYDPAINTFVITTGYSEFSECRLAEVGGSVEIAKMSIADAAMDEGDSGSSWMEFDVSLDRSASITVTAKFGISGETAIIGEDLVAPVERNLSFPPGSTQQTIRIEIVGDVVAEPHETFTVSLNTLNGARIHDGQAVGTILDDDGSGGYYLFLPNVVR